MLLRILPSFTFACVGNDMNHNITMSIFIFCVGGCFIDAHLMIMTRFLNKWIAFVGQRMIIDIVGHYFAPIAVRLFIHAETFVDTLDHTFTYKCARRRHPRQLRLDPMSFDAFNNFLSCPSRPHPHWPSSRLPLCFVISPLLTDCEQFSFSFRFLLFFIRYCMLVRTIELLGIFTQSVDTCEWNATKHMRNVSKIEVSKLINQSIVIGE